jgi:hypothetical protein
VWKYKNEEEVKEIRQGKKNAYKKIWRPLAFAVFLSAVLTIDIKLGYSKHPLPHINPITWGEFVGEWLLFDIIFGLLVFILSYRKQIVSKRRIFSGPDVLMCLKCAKVKNDDKICTCACGGEFVPLDELEWVDEEKNSLKNIDQ